MVDISDLFLFLFHSIGKAGHVFIDGDDDFALEFLADLCNYFFL